MANQWSPVVDKWKYFHDENIMLSDVPRVSAGPKRSIPPKFLPRISLLFYFLDIMVYHVIIALLGIFEFGLDPSGGLCQHFRILTFARCNYVSPHFFSCLDPSVVPPRSIHRQPDELNYSNVRLFLSPPCPLLLRSSSFSSSFISTVLLDKYYVLRIKTTSLPRTVLIRSVTNKINYFGRRNSWTKNMVKSFCHFARQDEKNLSWK